MAVTKMLHVGSGDVSSDILKGQRTQRRKSDPVETIFECVWTAVEAQYEDSDVSDDEFELAKRRFSNALRYLIIHTIEEFGNAQEQV